VKEWKMFKCEFIGLVRGLYAMLVSFNGHEAITEPGSSPSTHASKKARQFRAHLELGVSPQFAAAFTVDPDFYQTMIDQSVRRRQTLGDDEFTMFLNLINAQA
jgi:hypothetical protein